jgi:hypothetical protein
MFVLEVGSKKPRGIHFGRTELFQPVTEEKLPGVHHCNYVNFIIYGSSLAVPVVGLHLFAILYCNGVVNDAIMIHVRQSTIGNKG